MDKVDFGLWLNRSRLRRGLGLRETASLMGTSHTTVHSLETGRTLPNSGHVISAAKALGVDEVELLRLFGFVSSEPSKVFADDIKNRIDDLTQGQLIQIDEFLDYLQCRQREGARASPSPNGLNRKTAPIEEAAL